MYTRAPPTGEVRGLPDVRALRGSTSGYTHRALLHELQRLLGGVKLLAQRLGRRR